MDSSNLGFSVSLKFIEYSMCYLKAWNLDSSTAIKVRRAWRGKRELSITGMSGDVQGKRGAWGAPGKPKPKLVQVWAVRGIWEQAV